MEKLSYSALERNGYSGYLVDRSAPEKVLQFGEGNFLRAFVDRYLDEANEAGVWSGRVVMIQPRSENTNMADALNEQDGLYTVLVRGNEEGRVLDEARVVSVCSRCLNPHRAADRAAMMELAASDELELIISNTTEAGIVYEPSCRAADEPPASFPAKLAQVLHVRWAAGKPGVIILPCELSERNGDELYRIVRRHVRDWGWEPEFDTWLAEACTFSTTLVDTIVPGAICDKAQLAELNDRLGYVDSLLSVREPFQMWGIQGDERLAERLPFIAAKLPGAFVTADISPYKRRKVRILNGAHTGFVPAAWLAGFDIVRDCMHDEVVHGFMDRLLETEVIPTLAEEFDRADLEAFTASVSDRFDNPFIDHRLLSICLNSTSKWATRDLPTLLDSVEKNKALPPCLTMSLAALLVFYTSGPEGRDACGLHLRRADGTAYVASDDAFALDFFEAHAADAADELAFAALAEKRLWGEDLLNVAGLSAAVSANIALIKERGARTALASCLE